MANRFSETFSNATTSTSSLNYYSARIKRRFYKNIANLVVNPDCGFSVEVRVLYERFDPKDILLNPLVIAPDFTFQGDSRTTSARRRAAQCSTRSTAGRKVSTSNKLKAALALAGNSRENAEGGMRCLYYLFDLTNNLLLHI